MKRKFLLRVGLVLFILLLVIYGLKQVNPHVKKIAVLKKHFLWETDIEKVKIIDDRIVFWDGDYLVSIDQNGKVIEKVDHLKESLIPFFTDHYCFLYDEQLKKVYQYDGKGNLKNTIDMEVSIFNIVEQHNNIIIHGKRKQGEILYVLGNNGELEGFFKTGDFILSFQVMDPYNDYIVSELSTSAAGYKSRIYIKKGELEKYDYPSEVVMSMDKSKDVYICTEKTLYRLTDSKTIKKEVPFTTAMLVNKDKVYLLHSGILSTYNKDLEEVDKKILAANIDQLLWLNNGMYGIGKGDIIGNLLEDEEYYLKLGPQMEEIDILNDTVISKREHELFIYQLVEDKEQPKKGDSKNS